MVGPRVNSARPHGRWLIAVTLLIGLTLIILPLPAPLEPYRPEWALLIVLYWSLALPARVGVGVAWLIGLLQDILQATAPGAHALAFALAAYLTIQLYQRIRNVPIWQQTLTVLVLLLLARGVLFVTQGLSDDPGADWRFWLPAVTSTLIWPAVFVLLRSLRRRFQVN